MLRVARPSTFFDPTNPFVVPNLSGRLKEHDQPCDECGGRGYDEDDEPCCNCDWDGKLRWGCWYGDDKALCTYCGEENILVGHMYETSMGNNDQNYVCLPGYLKHHKEACGCGRWDWAEALILGGLR